MCSRHVRGARRLPELHGPIDNLPCKITVDPDESNGWQCHITTYTYINWNVDNVIRDLDWTMQGCGVTAGIQTVDYFFPVYINNGCYVEQAIMRILGKQSAKAVFVKNDDIHSSLIMEVWGPLELDKSMKIILHQNRTC